MTRRRVHQLIMKCAEPGCDQLAHFHEYDRREDYLKAYERYSKTPQYCTRHERKSEVLTPGNLEVTWHDELFCKNADPEKYARIQDQNFWFRADGSYGSGVFHGEHWQAWAKEFPRGTKIVVDVVARAILPEKELL